MIITYDFLLGSRTEKLLFHEPAKIDTKQSFSEERAFFPLEQKEFQRGNKISGRKGADFV